jgi:hypothetical protein
MPTEPVKPGYLTSEFYLTIAAMFISTLFASGVITTGGTWDKILGLIAGVLSALGYAVTRAIVKK